MNCNECPCMEFVGSRDAEFCGACGHNRAAHAGLPAEAARGVGDVADPHRESAQVTPRHSRNRRRIAMVSLLMVIAIAIGIVAVGRSQSGSEADRRTNASIDEKEAGTSGSRAETDSPRVIDLNIDGCGDADTPQYKYCIEDENASAVAEHVAAQERATSARCAKRGVVDTDGITNTADASLSSSYQTQYECRWLRESEEHRDCYVTDSGFLWLLTTCDRNPISDDGDPQAANRDEVDGPASSTSAGDNVLVTNPEECGSVTLPENEFNDELSFRIDRIKGATDCVEIMAVAHRFARGEGTFVSGEGAGFTELDGWTCSNRQGWFGCQRGNPPVDEFGGKTGL